MILCRSLSLKPYKPEDANYGACRTDLGLGIEEVPNVP